MAGGEQGVADGQELAQAAGDELEAATQRVARTRDGAGLETCRAGWAGLDRRLRCHLVISTHTTHTSHTTQQEELSHLLLLSFMHDADLPSNGHSLSSVLQMSHDHAN